jgi:hypothetical protein
MLCILYSSSRRPVRILGAVVEIPAFPVLNLGKQVTVRHGIAFKFVSDHHSRHVLQALQQPLEEALRSAGVGSWLNENVEHHTILIDGTPQVMLDALDPDEHLVHMPFVARPGPPTAHCLCKATAKLLAPPP